MKAMSLISKLITVTRRSHNAEAAAALYIKSKLVGEMGFDYHLVDNVLRYQKDIINNDIQRAVDMCIKTDEGWKHTFISDENEGEYDEYSSSFSEDEINGPLRRIKWMIWGEGLEDHQRSIVRRPQTRRIIENSFSTEEDIDISFQEETKFNNTAQVTEDKGIYIHLISINTFIFC